MTLSELRALVWRLRIKAVAYRGDPIHAEAADAIETLMQPDAICALRDLVYCKNMKERLKCLWTAAQAGRGSHEQR